MKPLNSVKSFIDSIEVDKSSEDIINFAKEYQEDLINKVMAIREIKPLSKVLSKRSIVVNESNKSILPFVNKYYDELANQIKDLKISAKEIKSLEQSPEKITKSSSKCH